MKTIFTVISYNSKYNELCLYVRNTEKEAKELIDSEIRLLKENENVSKIKLDYEYKGLRSLADNEHNAYCKTDDAEYYWKTGCIGFMEGCKHE